MEFTENDKQNLDKLRLKCKETDSTSDEENGPGYIYITIEKNSDKTELNHLGRKKMGVGKTNNTRRRLGELNQTSSKNTSKVEMVYTVHVNNMKDIETKTHDILKWMGYYNIDGKREVFSGINNEGEEISLDIIKGVIQKASGNLDIHKEEIILKPHQETAINKAIMCFEIYGKCLWFHKARSGKTYGTAFLIKENDYKNVLILTSFPILNYQWKEVFETHKGFSETEIIIGSDLDKIKLEPNKKYIFLLSLQDTKGNKVVLDKEKFEPIKDIIFDLLVIDEVHHGVETEKTHELLDKIKYKKLLGLSATPTKNLLCGSFSKDEMDIYTLSDEYEMKKKYPELYPYPDINFLMLNLEDSEKSQLKYFSDEEQFKFDKFFRIENDNFYYRDDIVYIFKKLIGDKDICEKDNLSTLYPFKNKGRFSDLKSILLFLPNIESQYKLKEILDDLDSYNGFDVHITNSNENSSKKLIRKIKNDFKSGNKRSLILAVDQLTTGITLDDCDMVVFMNDWRSLDKYIQASFRPQSPRKGKKDCWVIDLNPARSFTLIWEYLNLTSKHKGEPLTKSISEWLECVNIFNRVEGEFIKVDFDGFNKEYNKAVLEKPRFNYQSVILQDKLSSDEVGNALISIGINGGSSSTEENLNDDGIDKGKSKKTEKKNGEKKKEEGISQVKLMEIAKALVDKTMLLSIFTYFKYDNIDDCFMVLENDNTVVNGIGELERNMYLETLLLGMNDVDKIDLSVIKYIYDNIYDKEIINKKLFLFNQSVNLIYNNIGENPEIINDMLKNLMELVDSYLKPSNTEKRLLGEVFTPLYGKPGCVEDQLNLIEDSFWRRKDVKVLDPCAGVGNYSVVLVEKFMKGLVDEFPDSEERLKWILEEIIYVNEYQSKNLFIYLQLFDPENKYKMNFNRGDYLKLDIKETFGVENFDLICTNPPYNKSNTGKGTNSGSIYQEFISKSLKESDTSIFIVPKKWSNNSFKEFRKEIIDYGISNIIIIEKGDDIFSTKGVGEVSILKFTKGVYKMVVNHYLEIDLLLNRELLVDGFLFDDVSLSIINKIKSKSDRFLNDLYKNPQLIKTNLLPKTNKIKKDNGVEYKLRISKGKDININLQIEDTELRTLSFDKYKVSFEKIYGGYINGNFSQLDVLDKWFITTEGISYFEFDRKIDADNFLYYINTKFSKYLRLIKQYDRSFTSMIFSYIPVMNFNIKWTDEQLFDYFELSEEEKNIILNYDNNRK